MDAFLISTGIVALAEIGDKTQLLAFILATRFSKPVPIMLGILVATLANHAAAGTLGTWITSFFDPETLRWIVGLSFILIAGWVLVPDKFDPDAAVTTGYSVFGTTLVTFFIAEIGDKTQVATIVLAAHYQSLLLVVLGTTLGMMIANIPAVMLGEHIARRISVPLVRIIAGLVFALLGIATLTGVGSDWGL